MKKRLYLLLTLLTISAFILAACGSKANTESEQGVEPTEGEPVVPDQYKDLKNPFAGQSDAADSGKKIYTEKCATCHGDGGKGDGPGGAALNPKPEDLTVLAEDPDGMVYWRIAEGGVVSPFKEKGSAMPAWMNVLSQDEIWQVVTYVRTMK